MAFFVFAKFVAVSAVYMHYFVGKHYPVQKRCVSGVARNDVRKPWQALFRPVAIKAKWRPKTTPI